METQNPIRIKLFWDKVNKGGPFVNVINPNFSEEKYYLSRCWIWTGANDGKYGNFTVAKGKTAKAHRFSFKLAFGWILDHPYQVDHKCKNTLCVNPSHLMLLHYIKNNEKSNSPSAINKRKTHCLRGHRFTKENTIIFKDGHRRCKQCIKDK